MAQVRSARTAGPWLVIDSGVQTGARNMEIDQKALDGMMAGLQKIPTVRFFQWDRPVVTYGYLMDPARVAAFARENGDVPAVKRPTGGGTVLHQPEDLSLSLLWPRKSGLLPDLPRDCYAVIHDALRDGIRRYLGDAKLSLHVKSQACEPNGGERFSLCFQEPVCDDVMLGDRKIIGGALRITRGALLYQGAVQLRRVPKMEKLKAALLSALTERILAPATSRPAKEAS